MSVVVIIMNGTTTRPSVSTVPTAAPAAIEMVNWSVPRLHLMNPKDGPEGWGGMQLCFQHRTISHQLYAFCPGNHVAWKVERTPSTMSWGMERTQSHTAVGSPKWRSPQRSLVTVKWQSYGALLRNRRTFCWYKWPLFDLREIQREGSAVSMLFLLWKN